VAVLVVDAVVIVIASSRLVWEKARWRGMTPLARSLLCVLAMARPRKEKRSTVTDVTLTVRLPFDPLAHQLFELPR
jgi:hypothetical protein